MTEFSMKNDQKSLNGRKYVVCVNMVAKFVILINEEGWSDTQNNVDVINLWPVEGNITEK